MKAKHLLPALAMVLVSAMPALAHGQGHGWGRQARDHWQQAPVQSVVTRQVPVRGGYGHWQPVPVRYGKVVQPVYGQPCPPTRIVTRQVPVYVPVRPVVYQQAPVVQHRRQQPGASVVFRVNL
jgi:hypothetical protein